MPLFPERGQARWDGRWTHVSANHTAYTGQRDNIYFYLLDGGVSTGLNVGDQIYIDNVKIRETNIDYTCSIGIMNDLKYCNYSAIIGDSGNWTNVTLSYTTDSGIAAVQTNGSYKTNESHKYIRFNVTGYNADGSLEEGSLTNITAKIDFNEVNLDDSSPDYGITWYNGTDWLNLNVTNMCANGYGNQETNYSTIVIGSDTWYGCYNDSNSNGIIDQLKIMIPHTSVQQFEAYHSKLPFRVITVDAVSNINLISSSNKTIYVSFNTTAQDIDMSLTTVTFEKSDQSSIASYHCQSISNYTT